MDVIFDFATAVAAKRVTIVGTMTRPLVIEPGGEVDMLGVRFRPGGLPLLLKLDAGELLNRSVEGGATVGRWANTLWHRLAETPPARRPGVLRTSLESRWMGAAELDPYVRYCVGRLVAVGGALPMAMLERGTGLGLRQLERRFARTVGVSPKTFARVVRFERVVDACHSRVAPAWARLASEVGYADQSHLVREFTAFAGVSPGAFRREIASEAAG